MVVFHGPFQVVELVWIGRLGEQSGFKVWLEGLLDLVRLVDEVQHAGIFLLGPIYSVQPAQRLNGINATELLIHVHRVEQRLIKASLELLCHDQQPVLLGLERGRGLRFREPVHAGFGELLAAVRVLHFAREGNQRLVRQPPRFHFPIEVQLVPHRMQPGTRHHHRLRLAGDPVLYFFLEMVQHHRRLGVDSVRVQIRIGAQQVGGFLAVELRVGFNLLQQREVDLERRVVLQHVKDEAFLDGLPHRVQAERREAAAGLRRAEQLQRLLFRCGRECEETHVV